MLAPSLAIGWTIWRRHRWGLLGVLAYVSAAAATGPVLPWYVSPPMAGVISTLLAMPLIYVAMHLIGVFSYGFEADINARQSCFPPGWFTLPVRTGALVGWPLAYGAAAIILLWLVTAGFILLPLGLLKVVVPLWWPATLAMATLATFQALLWFPFGLPLVRAVVGIVVIAGAITAAEIGATSGASEGVLAAFFAAIAAVAWSVAYAGVRRARRGDVPNWEGIGRPFRRIVRRQARRPRPFVSVGRAQVWFEWKRTGMLLPLMTALVLPFVLLPLLWGQNDAIPTSRTLLIALAVPVFLASIAATTVSGKNAWVKDYYGVAPSTATMPMSTAGMVAAKLKAAAWSTFLAWTLVTVAVPLTVVLTGNGAEVTGWWQQAIQHYAPLKIVAGMTAAAILLIVWTWKHIVDSLFLGLTGRKWVIQGTLIVGMAGFFFLCLLGVWVYRHPETRETVFTLLPWVLGLSVLCRLSAAGWALRYGVTQGLFPAQTALRWMTAWLLLASLLIGTLAWSVPADRVPIHYLAFAVVTIFPMARLAATPLALAWNRHR
jgi:hypothetical protein